MTSSPPIPSSSDPHTGVTQISLEQVSVPAARMSRGGGVSSLSHALRAVLRCPMTRAKLVAVDEHHLMSEQPFREGVHPVFAVKDGIPNFLPLAQASDTP